MSERRERLADILKVLGQEIEIDNVLRANYHDFEDSSEDFPARIIEWKEDRGKWVVYCKVTSVRWGEFSGFDKKAKEEVEKILSHPAGKLGVDLKDFEVERTNIKTLLQNVARKVGEEKIECWRIEYWVTPENKRIKLKEYC